MDLLSPVGDGPAGNDGTSVTTSVQRLAYARALFVERPEVEWVRTIVADIVASNTAGNSASARRPEQARTLVFYGERGSGKSWLCQHLQRDVLGPMPNVITLFLGFYANPHAKHEAHPREWYLGQPIDEADPQSIERVRRDIVIWIAQHIGATVDVAASTEAVVEALIARLQSLPHTLPHTTVVFILDSIFEQAWTFLEQLESPALASLARQPNTLFVMTGRGRLYPWQSPYLRMQAIYAKLSAFDLKQTQAQLEKLGLNDAEGRAETVLALGGGTPLSNALLAQSSAHSPAQSPAHLLGQVVAELLSPVPNEHTQRSIQALSILRDGFREDEIPVLVAAMEPDPEAGARIQQWTLRDIRHMRDVLTETRLVQWDNGRYLVDESVRVPVQNWLRLEHPQRWRHLVQTAADTYAEWARKYEAHYPNSARHYAQQALYYRELAAAPPVAAIAGTPGSNAAPDASRSMPVGPTAQQAYTSQSNPSSQSAQTEPPDTETGTSKSLLARVPLVGRMRELAAISRIADPNPRAAQVMYLTSEGGVGKTRLLEEALRHLSQTAATSTALQVVDRVIDLYDIALHVPNALALRLFETYSHKYGGAAFARYQAAEAEVNEHLASGNAGRLSQLREQSLRAFEADLMDLTTSLAANTIVIFSLDTLEKLWYGGNEALEDNLYTAPAWLWLIDLLQRCTRLRLIVAGRPQSQRLIDRLQVALETTDAQLLKPTQPLQQIEMKPFEQADVDEYFARVIELSARSADPYVRGAGSQVRALRESQKRLLAQCAQQKPILLSLFIHFLGTADVGQVPHVLRALPDQDVVEGTSNSAHDAAFVRATTAELTHRLIHHLKHDNPHQDILTTLSLLPKGADANLVAELMKIEPAEAQAQLDALRDFIFIKVRSDGYVFFHDEIYRLMNSDLTPLELDARHQKLEQVVGYYDRQAESINSQMDALIHQLIATSHATSHSDLATPTEPATDAATDAVAATPTFPQQFDQLLRARRAAYVEGTYYALRQDAARGFRRNYRLARESAWNGDSLLHRQLNSELLSFMAELDLENAHHPGNPDHIRHTFSGLDRQTLLEMMRSRELVVLCAEGKNEAAIYHAAALRDEVIWQERSPASIDIWEATAHSRLGERGDLTEAVRLLGRGIATLQSEIEALGNVDARSNMMMWRTLALLGFAYYTRGYVRRVQGHLDHSKKDYVQAIDILKKPDFKVEMAFVLNNLGFAECELGEYTAARMHVETALIMRRKYCFYGQYGLGYNTRGIVYGYEEKLDDAIADCEFALTLSRQFDDARLEGLAAVRLSEAYRRKSLQADQPDQIDEQRRWLQKSMAAARTAQAIFSTGNVNEAPRRIESLIQLGCACRKLVQMQLQEHHVADHEVVTECRDAFLEAAVLAQAIGIIHRRLDALVNLGWLEFYLGDAERLNDVIDQAQAAIPKGYEIDPAFGQPTLSRMQAEPLVWPQIGKLNALEGRVAFTAFRDQGNTALLQSAFRSYRLGLEYSALLNPILTAHRDFKLILKEIETKWHTLQPDEQSAVATAIDQIELRNTLGPSPELSALLRR